GEAHRHVDAAELARDLLLARDVRLVDEQRRLVARGSSAADVGRPERQRRAAAEERAGDERTPEAPPPPSPPAALPELLVRVDPLVDEHRGDTRYDAAAIPATSGFSGGSRAPRARGRAGSTEARP